MITDFKRGLGCPLAPESLIRCIALATIWSSHGKASELLTAMPAASEATPAFAAFSRISVLAAGKAVMATAALLRV